MALRHSPLQVVPRDTGSFTPHHISTICWFQGPPGITPSHPSIEETKHENSCGTFCNQVYKRHTINYFQNPLARTQSYMTSIQMPGGPENRTSLHISEGEPNQILVSTGSARERTSWFPRTPQSCLIWGFTSQTQYPYPGSLSWSLLFTTQGKD